MFQEYYEIRRIATKFKETGYKACHDVWSVGSKKNPKNESSTDGDV